MKTIGNIIWFLLVGIPLGIGWIICGIIWCITIIGIPFGLQCFKIASLAFFPFGKVVSGKLSSHVLLNIVWIIFGGFLLAVGYAIAGAIFYITIIGIPFGKQCFKLAGLSLAPFGSVAVKTKRRKK